MRKGGGHAKGAHFERVIAKDIVKAFKAFGIKQRECWRSVGSGGHVMACGDLEMSDKLWKLFPYSVECKHRKKIKLENLLLHNKKSQEIKWLEQAVAGRGKRTDLGVLLIMKANNMKTLTMRWLGSHEAEASDNMIRIHGRQWKVRSWKSFLKSAVKRASIRRKSRKQND